MERLALDILRAVRESDGTVGKRPMGLAATALYMAFRLKS